MKGYKKYRTIHTIAYIAFFIYIIILAINNSNLGFEAGAAPYHIIIPFIIYCIIAIGAEILTRKEIKEQKESEKEDKIKYSKLSGV